MLAGVPAECNRQVHRQHLKVLEPTESIYWVLPTQSASSPLPCKCPPTALGRTDPRRHTDRNLSPSYLSSAIMPGMPTALTSGWLGCKDQGFQQLCFRAKPAKMNKVHPPVALMPLCKHAADWLLSFNFHLLLLHDSQNDAHVFFICANDISL